jgi:hypothetical protein
LQRGGVSGIIEEHSDNIERTGEIRMGELDYQGIETTVEERNGRDMGY